MFKNDKTNDAYKLQLAELQTRRHFVVFETSIICLKR